MCLIIQYLKDGILPQAEKEAKELVLNKGQYVLVDNVLYHVAMDGTLRIVSPSEEGKTHLGSPWGKVSWSLKGCKDLWTT